MPLRRCRGKSDFFQGAFHARDLKSDLKLTLFLLKVSFEVTFEVSQFRLGVPAITKGPNAELR